MEKHPMGFSCKKRLLKAAEYKNVFDNADFKVSLPGFLLLATTNNFDHARLGIIVAKRNIRLATQRNQTKRLIRESFRKQADLPKLDIVILARQSIASSEKSDIHQDLMVLWRQLKARYMKRTSIEKT